MDVGQFPINRPRLTDPDPEMCLFFPPAERPDCPVQRPQCVCRGCPGLLTPAVPSRGGSERPRSDQRDVQHHLVQKGCFFQTIHWDQNQITVWGPSFCPRSPCLIGFLRFWDHGAGQQLNVSVLKKSNRYFLVDFREQRCSECCQVSSQSLCSPKDSV